MQGLTPRHALIALIVGMGASFAADVLTPPVIADGIAYPAVLAFCLWIPSQRTVLIAAVAATLLTLLGAVLLAPVGLSREPLIDRAIVIGSIWILCFLIHERLAMEAQLRAREDQAMTASQAKSTFLANMSHEFRTPLNAVIGFAELIVKAEPKQLSTAKIRDYAGEVLASGRHLLKLINDLLDFAKIEVGKYRLEEETVRVSGVIAEVVRAVEPAAHQAGLMLSVQLEPGLPALRADRRALKQTLLNLFANALKYTGESGHISLSVGVSAAGMWFQVADTGVGIAASDLARLGRPFEQGAAAALRMAGGLGLGLALCRTLMELHGGTLEIASVEGSGTTVRAIFPHERVIAVPAAPARDALAALAAKPASGR